MSKHNRNFIDLTGQVFGRLTVIGEMQEEKHGHRQWLCQCICGKQKIIAVGSLKNGLTKSCGCLCRDVTSARNKNPEFKAANTIHGLCGSSEYTTWKNIHSRCENPNSASYYLYGARGIRVCERWHDFPKFFQDMGYKPSSAHSIERRDNNGPYAPDNCYWATAVEQARNRRTNVLLSFNGETKLMRDWARIFNIKHSVLYSRIKSGKWTIEKALTFPVRKHSISI